MIPDNMIQMAQQLKQNPFGFLLQIKMNVPANICNDPYAIMNYLLSTGQIGQSRINNAYRLLQNSDTK